MTLSMKGKAFRAYATPDGQAFLLWANHYGLNGPIELTRAQAVELHNDLCNLLTDLGKDDDAGGSSTDPSGEAQ